MSELLLKEGESYVANFVNGTAHDNNFLDTKKSLWVFGGSQGEVGEWPNSDDGYAVDFILT